MVSQKYGPTSQANISRTEPPISLKVRSSFPLISLFQIHPTDPQHCCAHFKYYIPPGYTINKRPKPVDTNLITAVEQQEIVDWEWKDQQAYVAICLRINDDYMVYTHNMTTSKGVWDTLAMIFEASRPIGIINT